MNVLSNQSFLSVAQEQVCPSQEPFEFIKTFFNTMFTLNKQVLDPVSSWIDENDEAFQELVCHVDDERGRIWRAVDKHSTLHAGLNTLSSINGIINQNLIQSDNEPIMRGLIQNLYDQFSAYITSSGHLTQGWTQAWRLCTTNWDLGSLEDPQEEPDEDDRDDWLPRYQVYTKPDSSISSLRGLERVLDSEGWEAAYDGPVVKGYVVDLNIMQALLPNTMPFVDKTFRFVWEGPGDSSKPTESESQAGVEFKPFGFERFTSGGASWNTSAGNGQDLGGDRKHQAFDPSSWPAPTGSERMSRPAGSHLKSLSQQKGQDLRSFDYYTYAEPRGEGSWIFVMDTGFDLTHPVCILQHPLFTNCVIYQQC